MMRMRTLTLYEQNLLNSIFNLWHDKRATESFCHFILNCLKMLFSFECNFVKTTRAHDYFLSLFSRLSRYSQLKRIVTVFPAFGRVRKSIKTFYFFIFRSFISTTSVFCRLLSWAFFFIFASAVFCALLRCSTRWFHVWFFLAFPFFHFNFRSLFRSKSVFSFCGSAQFNGSVSFDSLRPVEMNSRLQQRFFFLFFLSVCFQIHFVQRCQTTLTTIRREDAMQCDKMPSIRRKRHEQKSQVSIFSHDAKMQWQ